MTLAATLAIGVLLFGEFGSTEGRILGTTAALAGYGLLALPAAMLYDRGRLPVLVGVVSVLACVCAAFVTTLIWSPDARRASARHSAP